MMALFSTLILLGGFFRVRLFSVSTANALVDWWDAVYFASTAPHDSVQIDCAVL